MGVGKSLNTSADYLNGPMRRRNRKATPLMIRGVEFEVAI